MQHVNTNIPSRDRAEVQLNLDRLNAIFPGKPLTQLDVVPDMGGSGYRLSRAAVGLVTERLAELLSHQVGSGSAIAPDVRLACAFFKVVIPRAVEVDPDVEATVLTPADATVEPVVLRPTKHGKGKGKH